MGHSPASPGAPRGWLEQIQATCGRSRTRARCGQLVPMLRTLAVWLALTTGVAAYTGNTVAQACSALTAGVAAVAGPSTSIGPGAKLRAWLLSPVLWLSRSSCSPLVRGTRRAPVMVRRRRRARARRAPARTSIPRSSTPSTRRSRRARRPQGRGSQVGHDARAGTTIRATMTSAGQRWRSSPRSDRAKGSGMTTHIHQHRAPAMTVEPARPP